MTMGQPAGRSAGNRTRPGARERLSLPERTETARLQNDPEAWPQPAPDVIKGIYVWFFISLQMFVGLMFISTSPVARIVGAVVLFASTAYGVLVLATRVPRTRSRTSSRG